MFRKKHKDITLSEISQRIRGFVMDSQIQNGHELAVLLGCSPLSSELEEKEEQESDVRTSRIAYLIPLIYAFSHTLADATTDFQRSNLKDADKVPDEVWQQSRTLMEQLSMSTLLGAISQLVDMGFLEIPRNRK